MLVYSECVSLAFDHLMHWSTCTAIVAGWLPIPYRVIAYMFWHGNFVAMVQHACRTACYTILVHGQYCVHRCT